MLVDTGLIRAGTILVYVLIWASYTLLVHTSATDERRPSSAILTLAVECIKLLMATTSFLTQQGLPELLLFFHSRELYLLLLRYFPVAVLYAIYNNLMITNLRQNQPSAYLILSNSRLIMTAAVWQWFFGKEIANPRKLALALITVGIFVKTEWTATDSQQDSKMVDLPLFPPAVWVMVQMACAMMASVVNEKLLKQVNGNTLLQNASLYLNSIAINLFIALVSTLLDQSKGDRVTSDLKALLQPRSLAIVFTLASGGIISSFVLRNEDSITKGVASASETIFTAIYEWVFWRYQMSPKAITSITLVTAGAFLYGNQSIAIRKSSPIRVRVRLTRFHRYSWAIRLLVSIQCYFIWLSGSHIFPVSPAPQKHLNSFLQGDPFQREATRGLRPLNDSCTKLTTNSSTQKLNRIRGAQDVVAYIITELEKLGAPVAINYGTVLHEFQDGQDDPCFRPRTTDKDIDLAVFEQHFHLIIEMKKEIELLLGWTILFTHQKRLFLVIAPLDDRRKRGLANKNSFQVNIYGFKCNYFDDFIFFPWDEIAVKKEVFLPMRPHKRVPTNITDNALSRFHMPFNAECLLANMYGADFMTPKEGHFIRKKAYDDPICNQSVLDASETEAWKQQLSFCGGSTPETKRGLGLPSDEAALKSFGMVTCIINREDAAHALALARDASEREDLWFQLEIFHQGKLSQFLTAKLESYPKTTVVDVHGVPGSCYAAALSVTNFKHVLLVEPSVILLTWNKKASMILKILAKDCSVTSTSHELDAVLSGLEQDILPRCTSPAVNFHLKSRTTTSEKLSVGPIFSPTNGSYRLIGSVSSSEQMPIAGYFNPTRGEREWVSHYVNLPLMLQGQAKDQGPESYIPLSSEFSQQVKTKWHNYLTAHRYLFLDRHVNWVAFDGGLIPRPWSNYIQNRSKPYCHSFNDLSSMMRSLQVGGGPQRVMLNVDLVSTADEVPISMHKHDAFGPIDFTRNSLPKNRSVSTFSWIDTSTELRNPCFPTWAAHIWLRHNVYDDYGSPNNVLHGKRMARVEEYIETLIHQEGASIVFDLKAPTFDEQLNQAVYISRFISRSMLPSYQKQIQQKVALRFLSDESASASVEALFSEKLPLEFQYYINVPSRTACRDVAEWGHRSNIKVGGCFVIEHDKAVAKSWEALSSHFKTIDIVNRSQVRPKIVCDVPRKQEEPDTSLWKDGLLHCIENGYDVIHHPFAVSAAADYSTPTASSRFPADSAQLLKRLLRVTRARLLSSLAPDASDKMLKTKIAWDKYTSYWGYTTPFDWELQRPRFLFTGSKRGSYEPNLSDRLIFRCITKVLTVMLFMRLEELGLLSMDDEISVQSPTQGAVTWRHVFSNTAGADGNQSGERFAYSNVLWSHVADAVANITGLTFQEAIRLYVTNSMGLDGEFDTDTSYPPYTARGYVGSIDDLLLIGCTLANGGVSPKMRRQVLSASSVAHILDNHVPDRDQFFREKTVRSMERFLEKREGDIDIVDGYGLGLWRVRGWRSEPNIPGWLLMGSSEALLYFDTTGLVVGMGAAQRVLGLELTAAFKETVRLLGLKWEKSIADL